MDLLPRATELARQAPQNKWFQAACVAAFVFLIYYITSPGSTWWDHYVRLSDAFLHGRLYLTDAPSWLELARVGEKGFVMDPPAPTLFVIPWVAIWGLSTNQVIICMLVGAAAMGLFWVAATQLGWSFRFRVAMTVLLAFGTNFWWVTTWGSYWMLAHVSAVFFLMAALVEATGKKRPWLVGLLVGLAGLSRLPTFLSFPFFAYAIVQGTKERWSVVRRLAAFGIPLAAMGGLFFLYTYGEYGTFTFGYEYGEYAARFPEGLLHVSHIPHSLYAFFFYRPEYVGYFPYFVPDTRYGLALFFTTPALLYMFGARLKERLTLAALVAFILILIPILMYGEDGHNQFGLRYTLDLLPFMAILVASGMRYRLNGLKIAVIVLSCLINLWGTLAINKLDWALW